ncbi:hypothetical protein L596_008326 [Steinernema carpocapsae]|uniref:Deoxynucleoside kinase domain-containing protein n=1 Tax=Steinernema carpocapsae TaxID=34508 RepID=A0A4U5PC97_STECR|nr:hypothetical protein L596_008326 [Steinernema carpocapsae]
MSLRRLICVEGNIASGKSSLISRLTSGDRGIAAVQEPLESWQNYGGVNPLGMMYSDPKAWAFWFQTKVQIDMVLLHSQLKPGTNVMERSIFSARYCFVENLRRQNFLTQEEHSALDSNFRCFVEKHLIKPNLFIYLRTKPEICHERLLKRRRPEEESVSLEYIKSLHDLHEEWLMNCKFPVEVIDANSDPESVIKSVSERLHDKYLQRNSA